MNINERNTYPVIRDLDGVYYHTERNGRMESICFSDLTAEERKNAIKGYDISSLKRLCFHLADCLRTIGDEL